MKTTLVTAAGSAAASAVVERLHADGHRVVGCDIYPKAWNAASGEADVFFQAVPVADEEAYTAQLLEAVEKNGVSFLIPLTDVEVDVLCGAKPRFAALGCAVCTPETAAVRLCRDKRIMTERLSQSGICRTIPTFSPYGYEPKAEDFPMMLKPVSGRSSQGQTVVRTREAFFSALAARKDLIAQPYLAGDIYTVDVARDRMGHVQTLARRELLRTVNGLGTTVRILPEHPLNDICARIAEHADVVGVVNMEFIGHETEYYFLEVNPRFSGGVGFSILAGVDFAALNIACHAGERIGPRAEARTAVMTRKVSLMVTEEA